jgi:FkbM family methyltransferase
MGLLKTIRNITRHPLNQRRTLTSLAHFARWQISARLAFGPTVYPWIGGSRMIVGRGDAGFTGNVYCGLDEPADMAFLLHVGQADDVFADVGANIGAYTVLAGAVLGMTCHSFEPIPATYAKLRANIAINHLGSRATSYNIGISGRSGTLHFTNHLDCMNRVIGHQESQVDAIAVPTEPLDEILRDHQPSILKIDVEGHESSVLDGAGKILSSAGLEIVILECNQSGERYGHTDEQMVLRMTSFGFTAMTYDPFQRRLAACVAAKRNSGNVLFIRNPAKAEARIAKAPRVVVFDHSL